MSKYTATIYINHNIIFKYSYGVWTKLIDGDVVSSTKGKSYIDFLQDVLNQYPIESVDQFQLIS